MEIMMIASIHGITLGSLMYSHGYLFLCIRDNSSLCIRDIPLRRLTFLQSNRDILRCYDDCCVIGAKKATYNYVVIGYSDSNFFPKSVRNILS